MSERCLGDSEGDVRFFPRARGALDDHVDIDAGIGERAEDGGDRAGPIRKLGQRDARFILVVRDAGDQLAFHMHVLDCLVADHHRSRAVVERR